MPKSVVCILLYKKNCLIMNRRLSRNACHQPSWTSSTCKYKVKVKLRAASKHSFSVRSFAGSSACSRTVKWKTLRRTMRRLRDRDQVIDKASIGRLMKQKERMLREIRSRKNNKKRNKRRRKSKIRRKRLRKHSSRGMKIKTLRLHRK